MPRHSRSRSRERHRDRDRRRSRSPDEKEERRRRRAKMWDVDPSGNVAPPTGDGTAAVGAGAHAMAAMQQTAMMTAVLQQQAALTRRARRLHVGNLPPGLNTDAIRELFNTTMNAAKLTLDENPCVCDVHMSGDARFSFVEFRSVLECSNALVLDGMQLLGKALKVQRPNDYQAPPPGLDRVIIPQSISAVVTSSTVPNATAGILGMHGANIAAMGGNPAMAAALSAAGVGPTNSVSGLSGAALAAMSMGHGAGAGALASVGAATALGQNHMGLTRRCRRIHVGNLPLGVGLTSEMLKQFFNAALVSANLHDTSKEGDPVVDSMLGTEGKFGFIEFRTIAEATSCIALNNIELGGKQLRIERPRDYAPMPDAMLDELRKQGILGNTSISPDGKDILGTSAAPPPPAAPTSLSASTGLLGLTGLPLGGAAAAPAGPPPINTAAATPVLVLLHMISEKDAGDEAEMGDILEDAKSECQKHGKCSLLSPKPGASGAPGSAVEANAIALKVFAHFATADAALACGKELHGKQFDGRTVVASFVPEATFEELGHLPCYAA